MSDSKLAFYDFAGGINTSSTDVMLGYGAKKLNWDDSYNVQLYKNQGVERMLGNQIYIDSDTADNSAIIGLCEYPKATDGFLYARAGGKIKYVDYVTKTTSAIHDYDKSNTSVNFT